MLQNFDLKGGCCGFWINLFVEDEVYHDTCIVYSTLCK